jgi:type IV fimbrial biogenesis protein FimU
MKRIKRTLVPPAGFTLLELLIVMAIMAIFVALATPSLITIIKNGDYRKATGDIVNVINTARSAAITNNIEQEVVFDPVKRIYGFSQANPPQAYGAIAFDPPLWSNLPGPVLISPAVKIQFTPNGAASASLPFPVDIDVRDETGVVRYTVSVTNTGRINVSGH